MGPSCDAPAEQTDDTEPSDAPSIRWAGKVGNSVIWIPQDRLGISEAERQCISAGYNNTILVTSDGQKLDHKLRVCYTKDPPNAPMDGPGWESAILRP
ncbi:unnamed protein product [Aspergillus oryzae]|nr:unnamed protein product [Aspergillus oryzae]